MASERGRHSSLSEAGYSSSPEPDRGPLQPQTHRIGTLKGFLPLSEEVTISTRGQNLPGIIKRTHSGRDRRNSSSQALRRRSDDIEAPLLIEGGTDGQTVEDARERRLSTSIPAAMLTPQMRSQRLIGNSNPRYQWEQYWKSEEELCKMKRPIREYYERCNALIQHYVYIDKLLDSSLPHNLIQEYQLPNESLVDVPPTIAEEDQRVTETPTSEGSASGLCPGADVTNGRIKVKRTPKDLYKLPDEETPLIDRDGEEPTKSAMPPFVLDENLQSGADIVTLAIYVNMAANTVLLILKIIVTVLTSSVSVLASLVDAVLDFLSTAIVWTTTNLISRQDQYKYPVGRRRLEPIGVLVFSVIMITSFFQVALEGISRLTSGDHTIVQLTIPAVAIMASTVIIKFLCWFWCRLIKNSSVQALAQDAMTDVVFNIFSIIFPLVGYYASVWWLDSLGGVLLSLYVMFNWANTSTMHIRNLTGAAASADERNVLLYLTMRFAKSIKQIQGLQAYHAGDKLNVEVDLVLDEAMPLRDSHDLGESLQYVLESVPIVDRAFVHLDYKSWNLPSHMQQQD